jgi:predicted TIM-barrel fold metal-dependent hydrolase
LNENGLVEFVIDVGGSQGKMMEYVQPLHDDESETTPGGYDPDVRINDLDIDGVWGEVLYPTTGLFVWSILDPELSIACAKAYNDWLAETFGYYSHRFAGSAMIPVSDIDSAVAEIERVARLGLRSLMLPMHPPADRPYHLDVWDPVWAAAQALGFPVSFHIATGLTPQQIQGYAPGLIPPAMLLGSLVFPQSEAHGALIAMVGGGMLDRFPNLQLVLVESGAGWLAWLVDCMDQALAKYGQYWTGLNIKEKPSDYVRRQVHVTFMDDITAINNRQLTGVAPLLWGTDYPHGEGTWPKTRETVERIFAGVPEDDRAAMLGGTLAKLYGFEVRSPAGSGK